MLLEVLLRSVALSFMLGITANRMDFGEVLGWCLGRVTPAAWLVLLASGKHQTPPQICSVSYEENRCIFLAPHVLAPTGLFILFGCSYYFYFGASVSVITVFKLLEDFGSC